MDDIAEVVGSALGVRPKPAAPSQRASEAALRGQVQLTPAEAAKSAAYERSPDNLAELRSAIATEKDPKNRQALQAELDMQTSSGAADDIGAVVGAVLRGQPDSPAIASEAAPSATPQQSADIGRIVAGRGAPTEKPGMVESIGAGAGKAFGSGVLAAQQLAGKGIETAGEWAGSDAITKAGKWLSEDAKQGAKKLEAENAPYEAANPKSNIGGQVVGLVASPLNKLAPGLGAGGGLGVTALRGAAQGAILNTLTTPVTTDGSFLTEKAKQAAIGAAGGTLGATLGYGLSKALNASITGAKSLAAKATTSSSPERVADEAVNAALTASGIAKEQITPELFAGLKVQALEAIKAGKGIDEAAMKRLASAQTLPVPVPMLQGQITRDPMQFAKERNLRGIRGVGEPLTEVMQAQNKALVGNLDALGANNGADVMQAGKSAIDTLSKADKAASANVTAAYKAFRDSTGRELDVPLQGLAQDYARILEESGPNIPAAVRAKFESLGLLSGTQQKLATITEMEGLIKNYINKNYDASNRPMARALDDLRKATQRAIEEGAGAGAAGEAATLAKAARAAAKARFNAIDSTPAYKAVVDGTEPDKFIQKFILQGNEAEIKSLIGIMNKQDPAAAKSLADSMMTHIKERILNRGSQEDGAFSLDKLKGFTRDPNMRARLLQVLGPERMATLRQLTDVAEDALYAPVASAVNTSNTASAAANLVNEAVSGGALNKALGVAKQIPVLSPAAQVAQEGVRGRRAADLVAEAVTPSVARQAGRSTVVDLTGLGALGGASYFGAKSRSRRQQ